jgi:two-component sensor histidine kinase
MSHARQARPQTPALKYEAVSEFHGQLILHWTEVGGPAVQMPTRQGFGSRVIERMIGQLKGKACFDWRSEGLVCEVTVQA